MLKKGCLMMLSAVLFLAGCQKKAEEAFDKTPDERLSQALTAYQQALVSAPNGWKVMVFPKGLQAQDIEVGGFSYYMQFTDNNRVTMLSDFDSATASTPKESGYRLKAVQRPSIYFDTYSYLHIPSDPTASVSRSPAGDEGYGWGSDFDFSFVGKADGDTLRLRGNFNNSEAIMIKATPQEAADYGNKRLAKSISLRGNLDAIGYFKKMTVGSSVYYISLDEPNKLITFSWLEGGEVQTFTTGYYASLGGIGLAEPFHASAETITEIHFLTWNPGSLTMNITVNGVNGTVSNGGQPLKIDLNAPKNWWDYSRLQRDFWFSVYGFTVNGKRDAFDIRSIPNFYFLAFWARYGTNFDALGVVKINDARTALTLPYASRFRTPTFTGDGRIIFPVWDVVGTVPPDEKTAFDNTVAQMADPNGYYFIQTGPLTYDMVSRDGKAWITWQF